MQTIEWEKFYIIYSWTKLHELIIIVVEYLIVSNLGSKYGIPMVKVESCLKYGLIHIM